MIAPGFTGGTLDRADRLRHDAQALADARSDIRARLLRLSGLDPLPDPDGGLGWDSIADAPDGAELLFLGFDAKIPCFVALDEAAPPVPSRPAPAIFGLLARLSAQDAAIYATARSLVDWHRRHGFCANCGNRSTVIRAGWGRHCPNCGAEHFPRVEPVVIMVAEHGDRALLGRQPSWPPGRYSALAGFLEVGESIEEAVARETFEEAGVRVRDIRYVASQPWPFPSSLMVACIGTAEDDAITIDRHELEDARWFTRDEVRAALSGDATAPFIAPPRFAIAHSLLSAWAAGE